MIYEFTDREYAVIVDSLSAMRDTLRAGGHPTPTVDAVIEKFGKWARPEGCEFLAVTGSEAVFMQGFRDGLVQGEDFSSGLTFEDPALNESYDRGVNAGIGLLCDHEARER